MKAARKLIPCEVAAGIDAEIEAIEAQGDPWYSTPVIALAFRMTHVNNRTHEHPANGFQGHLRKHEDLGLGYAGWFGACAVNKDTRRYQTWVNPDDAIEALQVSHRLNRYEASQILRPGLNRQVRIDKWRLNNGK